MWKKISNVILVVFILYYLYLTVCPAFLGSQIDREYASKIDTDVITQFANSAENIVSNTGFCVIKHDEPNQVDMFFGRFDETSKSSFINIRFEVFTENRYSPRARIKQRWVNTGFLPDDFDTVTLICKNNIRITISERTDNPMSKNAQLYLEKVLNYMEN